MWSARPRWCLVTFRHLQHQPLRARHRLLPPQLPDLSFHFPPLEWARERTTTPTRTSPNTRKAESRGAAASGCSTSVAVLCLSGVAHASARSSDDQRIFMRKSDSVRGGVNEERASPRMVRLYVPQVILSGAPTSGCVDSCCIPSSCFGAALETRGVRVGSSCACIFRLAPGPSLRTRSAALCCVSYFFLTTCCVLRASALGKPASVLGNDARSLCVHAMPFLRRSPYSPESPGFYDRQYAEEERRRADRMQGGRESSILDRYVTNPRLRGCLEGVKMGVKMVRHGKAVQLCTQSPAACTT